MNTIILIHSNQPSIGKSTFSKQLKKDLITLR